MLVFSNNARATISGEIPDGGRSISLTVTRPEDAAKFMSGSEKQQLVTVTHPSLPGVFEVMRVVGRFNSVFSVERWVETSGTDESTKPKSWPDGAVMEVRIPAAALNAFVQLRPDGRAIDVPMPLAINATSGLRGDLGVRLGGLPVLEVHDDFAGSPVLPDLAPAREIVGATRVVHIGQAKAAFSGSTHYPDGAVVVPTSANGYQYSLARGSYQGQEPSWVAQANQMTFAPDANGDMRLWAPSSIPAVITSSFAEAFSGDPVGLVVSEVGVIRLDGAAGAAAPVVSIGVPGNPTRYADQVSLSQISGNGQIHRIPVLAGGALAAGLVFTVHTESDLAYLARFYWKGFLVQTALVEPANGQQGA